MVRKRPWKLIRVLDEGLVKEKLLVSFLHQNCVGSTFRFNFSLGISRLIRSRYSLISKLFNTSAVRIVSQFVAPSCIKLVYLVFFFLFVSAVSELPGQGEGADDKEEESASDLQK